MDFGQFFGIDETDRRHWEELKAQEEKRMEQGGGVGHVVKEAVKPSLDMMGKGTRAGINAGHVDRHDNNREQRTKRTVTETEQRTEFVDDEPEFG